MSTKPWINYSHLYYFKTIVSEGGVVNAAKKLRLGQPTLSTQLAQFESVLNVKLFERKNRKLVLTEAGRMVFDYAEEIFKLGDELLDSLHDQHFFDRIQVQIGVCDLVPKHLIYKIYQWISSRFDSNVKIVSMHHAALMRELFEHKYDLVVTNVPTSFDTSDGIFSTKLAELKVVACGSKKFRNLAKDFPDSLADQPYIASSPLSRIRSDVDHFLKLKNISLRTVAEVHDTSLQKTMALHGEGIVFLPLEAVEEFFEKKELFNLGMLKGVQEDLWFVRPKRKTENPVIVSLLKDFSI